MWSQPDFRAPISPKCSRCFGTGRKYWRFALILLVFAAVALGVGTAAASIGFGAGEWGLSALMPLSNTRGVTVRPAFGPDDEDCVYVTRAMVLPTRGIKIVRELRCVE